MVQRNNRCQGAGRAEIVPQWVRGWKEARDNSISIFRTRDAALHPGIVMRPGWNSAELLPADPATAYDSESSPWAIHTRRQLNVTSSATGRQFAHWWMGEGGLWRSRPCLLAEHWRRFNQPLDVQQRTNLWRESNSRWLPQEISFKQTTKKGKTKIIFFRVATAN